MSRDTRVLAVNGGSSSIKFALFELDDRPRRVAGGAIERVGLPGTVMRLSGARDSGESARPVASPDTAAAVLADWVESRRQDGPGAIGHRVVHGGPGHVAPEPITANLLADLRQLAPFDPDHLPGELLLAEEFLRRFPGLPQVACFDTAFHHDLPRVARMLPIPRRYEDRGVRRYGFHGLSFSYIMEELSREDGAGEAQGRVILAHLGSGASLAAVHRGRPVDTSMGITPAGGLPMGTRSGDLDPGLAWYLMRTEGMSAQEFNEMVNLRSGLLGLSETTSDVRDLLAREADDGRAAEALAVFCYQARKWVGAFAAALGGLDTLVFSGGIGENSPAIRARVCAGLEFLGVKLEPTRNDANAAAISAPDSRVSVRIIRTDEELVIARMTARALGLGRGKEALA